MPSTKPSSTEEPINDQNHQDRDPPFEDVDLLYFNLLWSEINFCKINLEWSTDCGVLEDGTRTTYGNFPTDVGSSGVFSRELEDQVLTFTPAYDGYEDLETGTLWNILGQAVNGPIFGSSLTPIVSTEYFWFVWSVFLPDTEVWLSED